MLAVEESPSPQPSPREVREKEKSINPSAKLFDFGVAGQIIRTLAIDRIHHHALAVLQRGLADKSPSVDW